MSVTIAKHLGYVPASHQLVNHRGLCRNPHGHNYAVEVECAGEVHVHPGASDEGMVIDFSDIGAAWAKIKPIWDHMNLNVVLTTDTFPDDSSVDEQAAIYQRVGAGYPALTGPTTAENLATWLLTVFRMEGVPATAVTLWETPTSWARVKRDQ
jgi:6-pyruvoyltetrahydropterin/6-carboxytetrahydropterin synthase